LGGNGPKTGRSAVEEKEEEDEEEEEEEVEKRVSMFQDWCWFEGWDGLRKENVFNVVRMKMLQACL
jgi:hypothetical protein